MCFKKGQILSIFTEPQNKIQQLELLGTCNWFKNISGQIWLHLDRVNTVNVLHLAKYFIWRYVASAKSSTCISPNVKHMIM